MNILVVTQYFWPESFRINDLVQGLSEMGHEVTILTGKPNYPAGKFYEGYSFLKKNTEYYQSMKVIRSPLIPRGKNSKILLALNYLSFAIFACIAGLRCKKADVIFVYEPSPITVGIPAIFLKKMKKIPIIFWVQDLWPESVAAVDAVKSQYVLSALKKIVHFIYHKCDVILTTSIGYFDSIRQFNISDSKLKYFPQTVENLYQPLPYSYEMPEEKMLPKGFRLLFSGNIGIAQDIDTILDAALLLKDYKEIKWIFLGDGSKREWLQERINHYQLNETVFWLGAFPPEKMPYFYACVDVLLVTLKKDPIFKLTIPAKIQSYLACGKPVVAALEGEGKRILEESGAAKVAESGNANALKDAVLEVYLLSQDQRDTMGASGLKYFDENFNRNMLLKKLEDWMKELIKRGEN